MLRTTWGDHDRFIQTYFSTYKGYYFTGDGCARSTPTATTGCSVASMT
jgi:acyl-coenzyme A synthetase/AMP-(fatty) acid ligase